MLSLNFYWTSHLINPLCRLHHISGALRGISSRRCASAAPKSSPLPQGQGTVLQPCFSMNVTELNLADNPAWKGDKGNTKGDKYDDIQCARFICPVVGLEMNGRHRFCFLRNCGCVFSERALKEIKTEVCHRCGVPFQDDDVIILNGSKEDVEVLKKRMEERRLKSKVGKKSKKCKATELVSQQDTTEDSPGPSEIKTAKDDMNTNSGERKQIVFTKGAEANGSSSASGKISKASAGTTKRSIVDSEEKSEAYKSIFTSHSSAKRSKEESSNWITHTAYYF
ncbi:replication termination factor 2 isoform X2 [Chelonoidis abingdonii]|uniref:replication termination factor 2 isoform X2 n=1 Tax=Chelonoidis abingdonii TaxID=106734 RepID=UPI003F4944AC